MERSEAAWMLREEARTISSGDHMGEAMSIGADALDSVETLAVENELLRSHLQELISAIILGQDIGVSRITEIISSFPGIFRIATIGPCDTLEQTIS